MRVMSENDVIDIFGDNLKYQLLIREMSQQHLSYLTGISKSTISKYINRQQLPSLMNILRIMEVLDCEFSDLIYIY